jgi:hypothetical protein
MTTPAAAAAVRPSSPRWVHVLLALGVISGSASILLLGWLSVWFQIGSRADRGDYLIASGFYDIGVPLMIVGALAAWVSRAPQWLTWWCRIGTVLFVILSVNAHGKAADEGLLEDRYDTWWGGAGTALLMPWIWLVPLALVAAVVTRRHASPD